MAGMTTVAQAMEAATGGRVWLKPGNWWNWHIWHGEEASSVLELDEVYSDSSEEYFEEESVSFEEDYGVTQGDVDRYSPGEGIRGLDIDIGGCGFQTVDSYDDSIYLEVKNAHKFQCYVEDDVLYIRSSSRSPVNWSSGWECQIVLYLPAGYQFDSVEAEVGAGSLSFSGIHAGYASLEVGGGEIVIDNGELGELEVSVGAGLVMLEAMEVERLDAEIGMGQFTAEGALYGDADIECSMGSVELVLEGKQSDYNYALNGAMGNISIGEDSFAGFAQEKQIDNGAAWEIEVECSMGDITVTFEG